MQDLRDVLEEIDVDSDGRAVFSEKEGVARSWLQNTVVVSQKRFL